MIPFRFFVFFILSLTFCCGFVHPKVPQAEGTFISLCVWLPTKCWKCYNETVGCKFSCFFSRGKGKGYQKLSSKHGWIWFKILFCFSHTFRSFLLLCSTSNVVLFRSHGFGLIDSSRTSETKLLECPSFLFLLFIAD